MARDSARPPLSPREARGPGWSALLAPERIPALAVLLCGVLLHSMNVLLLATVLPSIVRDVGGAALMSWPTTAFLASSIVAATGAGRLSAAIGPGRAFSAGAVIFCAGALLCGLAPGMSEVVGGRFVQGFGGGLLLAMAYVLVRGSFPEALWARVFALLAGVWTVAVLVGPLVGGIFARQGNWRGAFLGVAIIAGLLALAAPRVLPGGAVARDGARGGAPRVPGGRVGLICLAIAAMSVAALVSAPAVQAGLIAAGVAALAAMLRLDRRAELRILPGDAFSLHSATGLGLWLALLVSMAYSPLGIYVPAFLQGLHGFDPLGAGYTVAGASMAWTVAAVGVAGLPDRWSERMLLAGPAAMGCGLLGMAAAMPAGPVGGLFPSIVLVGAGIGACWAFTAQRIMRGAMPGEGDVAASSVATVQQTGFAVGAALAGLVANSSGFSLGRDAAGIAGAAFWVPAAFAVVAATAGIVGARLRTLGRGAGRPMPDGEPGR